MGIPSFTSENKDILANQKSQAQFQNYVTTIVQRFPKYGIKKIGGKDWRTVNKPLPDVLITEHLNGKRVIGALGKWYPNHASIDIDQKGKDYAEEIRDELGLSERNSMLFPTESPNHHQIILRPTFNGKPPTLNFLNTLFKDFCSTHGVEIYPQSKHVCRLPFSDLQTCLDFDYATYETYWEKLYWFLKLDDFDLAQIPKNQEYLPLDIPENENYPDHVIGGELIETGLQAPDTRYKSQFQVLLHLWRKNLPIDTAIETTWLWIKNKHNGLSEKYPKYPRQVLNEIKRQAYQIYSKYTYPDETHNSYRGWITKPDIEEIFKIAGGSLPKTRFLFHLVKFTYPRRYRDWINVHSDHLMNWSSSRYLDYIQELQEKKLLRRKDNFLSKKYIAKNKLNLIPFAKELRLNWKYQSIEKAILVDDRAPTTLEKTLKAVFKPTDLKSLLSASGIDRRFIYQVYDK